MSKKPVVFNYNDYLTLEEEVKALRATVANLEIRCRIAESEKPKAGRWELKGKPEELNVVCSECGGEAPFIKKTVDTGKGKRSLGVLFESEYCPRCGSRMEVEE